MRQIVERIRRRLPGLFPAAPLDPMLVLEVQARLTRLAREVDELVGTPGLGFAAGHHVRAASMAFEHTLDEACRLAGVPVPLEQGPLHRLLAEAALVRAGWTW